MSILEVFGAEDWKLAVPVFVAFIAWSATIAVWFLNERKKRIWEQYKRKEKSYSELLRCLRGFYMDPNTTNSTELKEKFIHQLNLCWLYCPDDIINAGYKFLDAMHNGNPPSNKNPETMADDEHPKKVNRQNMKVNKHRKEMMNNLIFLIRKDILSRKLIKETKLNSDDFKHFSV